MAAKRFFEDTEPHQNYKRMRTIPSFASVIKEAVRVDFLDKVSTALEPMLRRVVHEEVENVLRRGYRTITRSPSLRIKALEPSNLRLTFTKKLSLPIFTASKIAAVDGSTLQILLVDTTGEGMVPTTLPYPIKLEIVVLDGDFPSGQSAEDNTWTHEEFNKGIVKERNGKRPLLAGEVNFTMRDGFVAVGEIEFTDNSSWIRGRRFRLGVRVVQIGTSQTTVRITEGVTEAFMVKDHRGELYKKHYPPALGDDVWRLEKIGKDGTFHKKLSSHGINTVQDFLKLAAIDTPRLRTILGSGMSERMWEVTYKHAKTCELGTKLYMARGQNYFLGDGMVNEPALLTQGEPMMNQSLTVNHPQQQPMLLSYQRNALLTDASEQLVEYNDWINVTSTNYIYTPPDNGGVYFSDAASSDGDLR